MKRKQPFFACHLWHNRINFLWLLLAAFGGQMSSVHADDGPTVIKTEVFAGVYQSHHLWVPATKSFQNDTTSWMPSLKFAVAGPVPGGSQFSVDFTKPDGKPWLSLDCPTDEIKAGEWDFLSTPRDTSTETEKKYSNGTGVFGFKIRLKNELTGEDKTMFSGKFKVGKVSRSMNTPVTKNLNDFYVEHDWVLPMGYLYIKPANIMPPLAASMWFKGETNGADLAAYLFYKGKQIGSTKEQGSASTVETELRTISGEKTDPAWRLWQMEWFNVAATAEDPEQPNEKLFYLDKNPGDYEIKVLRGGKLSRQAAFTVGADGKITDSGVGTTNNLKINRFVIPVKIVGTTDGTWDKTAWETSAFYGNPLKGFTISP